MSSLRLMDSPGLGEGTPSWIPRFRSSLRARDVLRAAALEARPRRRPDEVGMRAFEAWFARTFGYPAAAAVSSVRFGLFSVMKILGYPPGSEILCTPITVRPIIDALRAAGLAPTFVDICARDFAPRLDSLAAARTSRSRAVLVTHLWGTAADLRPVAAWCDTQGLDLIEDGSQCLGGWIGDQPVGLLGLAGLFSLGATKTLGMLRGAMLVSRDPGLVNRVREAHGALALTPRRSIWGWAMVELALKGLFTQAGFSGVGRPVLAIGRALRWSDRLQRSGPPRVPRIAPCLRARPSPGQVSLALATAADHHDLQARRREIVATYRAVLGDQSLVRMPRPASDCHGNGWVNVVFHDEPEHLRGFLWRRYRVDTGRPSLDACHELLGVSGTAPQASRLLDTAVYLPSFPSLTLVEMSRVTSALRIFCRGAGVAPARS